MPTALSPRRATAWLLLTSLAMAQSPTGPTEPALDPRGVPGARLFAGGGRLPDTIYARFLELAGGDDARVVLVPTASSRADDAEGRRDTLATWQRQHPGVTFSILHTRDREEADSERFCEPLTEATGVWFGGGAQGRLAEAYVGTRVERELHALLARGGVVGGSSAGAAIQSRTMIVSGKQPPELGTGLDLVPGAIVDQHFLARDRIGRLRLALAATPGAFGIGVDEGTAVLLRGRDLEVLGASKALFVLPATEHGEELVTELASGDRADLLSWRRRARQRAHAAWPPEALPEPRVANGTLMLGGGGALPDTIFERFRELSGGDGARIVVVPSASPRRDGGREPHAARKLRALGCTDVVVVHPEHPGEVRDADLDAIERATGVWFGGGRQWRLVDAFEGTGAIERFHGVLRRGGVIGGSSAGATIQGEFLVRGSPLGNREMWCLGYDRGFAFLPGCAVDQHFVARDRLGDLQRLVGEAPQVIGIGVDEGPVAVVSGAELRVLGRSKVAILDARGARDAEPPTVTWLAPGQGWDLVGAARIE